MEDLFAVLVLVGIVMFAIIRLTQQPREAGPRVALLRLAHQGRLARPVDDLPGRRRPCSGTAGRKVNNIADVAEHAADMNGAFASTSVG